MNYDKHKIQEAYEKILDKESLDEGVVKFTKDMKKMKEDWKTVSNDIEYMYNKAWGALEKKDIQEKIDGLLLLVKNAEQKMNRMKDPYMKGFYQVFIDQLQRSITTWQGLKK